MAHFDLRALLQRTVARVYGDLVTRPTGAAVRSGIEEALAELDGEQVAVIDFSTVRCLDLSCADEIVGKLLSTHGRARYFVLQGVSAEHCETIEQVLERHKLAVVARGRDGRVTVLGHLSEPARRALELLADHGPAPAEAIAAELDLPPGLTASLLEQLQQQRLIQQTAGHFSTLSSA
jgi:anti-anti-sigma regulatory factor